MSSLAPINNDKTKLYLMMDIEANGRCPGLHSMISLGLAGFTQEKGLVFQYGVNLHPLEGTTTSPETMEWWKTQPEAYAFTQVNQKYAFDEIPLLHAKLVELCAEYDVDTVGYPANFDWQWIHYYLHRFAGSNPLGYCAYDVDSYAAGLQGVSINKAKLPTLQHHHKALDDAIEQGEMFMRMIPVHQVPYDQCILVAEYPGAPIKTMALNTITLGLAAGDILARKKVLYTNISPQKKAILETFYKNIAVDTTT